MDPNIILNPAVVRIKNDAILQELLPQVSVSKGPKRPTGAKNPWLTVFLLTSPLDPDTKAVHGTMVINFFCDNYRDGNANQELLGSVGARLVVLFDDKPFSIEGGNNFNLHAEEHTEARAVPENPNEHFISVICKFSLVIYQ